MEVKIENNLTSPRTKWQMGAGESHLYGSASLAETLEIGATQATVIGGRHCGVARFERSKGDGVRGWVNYYDEAFYVIRGQGRFTFSKQPYEKKQSYEVSPGDYFYTPCATMVDIEPLGDEPFEWFYCAGIGEVTGYETLGSTVPESSGRMPIHNIGTADYQPWRMGAGEPHLFGSASLSPTIALSGPQTSRIDGRHCGIARFEKSQGDGVRGWVNWYDEAFYVISGRGRFTFWDPSYETKQDYDVGPGDYFYRPLPAKLEIEPHGDEPFDWFYSAGFLGSGLLENA